MASMVWNETLSVGVKALDDDHKKLVDMINELLDGILKNRRQETLHKVLDNLIQYTRLHFAREESYFVRTGYPNAAQHIQQHRALVQQVTGLQARLKAGDSSLLSLELMNFLKNWLTRHIMDEDKSYSAHLNSKGIS
ncbi:MAG TPA: bacteriohemerythrin [Terracidiphilus sp.]|nr:bacteriohemerythrin [Terracidiphilus sp.]